MSWQQQQFQRPLKLEIDLNQATFQAFLNCINSFQGLETNSMMEKGSSIMESKVSMDRFVYNLGVLAGITEEKAGAYDPEMKKSDAFKYWLKLVTRLKQDGFFKSPRRIAHL